MTHMARMRVAATAFFLFRMARSPLTGC